ncbi:HlyD family secretion protein [Salipiger thiooxidans]|uniref:HlyD family secretion protein n=1 Tax=Salipiger thiooxidans TaxID=282683 RepID=UPI001CD27CC0|nr:HlyD family efflux transporter periplasmic adaptor subunit [Salipiger thiooxidans]MCA0850026.1 HlyD family efflux transporter periplasmic adaptor subunit [Salipiger thiooxidans]
MPLSPRPLLFALALIAAAGPALAQSRFETLLARFGGQHRYEGIASSNGRIEAQSVDVATKYAGRVTEIMAGEGEIVDAGAVLAQLDDREARAQLLAAQATVQQAQASKQMAEANVMQAQSARDVAKTSFDRVERLNADGHASQSALDDATNALNSARASLASAEAQVANSDATIAAAEADVERLKIALDDMTIRAPIRGRILYRLREPGEVLAAGSAVFTLLDLTNVYMNIYLPAPVVGLLSANDEARMVLDPISDYVVPARVSFISPQAQFTPKSVETEEEREELVFRVKLTVPRDLLVQFEDMVKSGVRGIGFVRSDPGAEWPADLAVNVPE